MKKTFRKTFSIFLFIISFVLLLIPPALYYRFRKDIFISIEDVPVETHTLLVLGAGIRANKEPSAALQDRLDAAYLLYKDNKVERIIVSGARDSIYYDEPKVMKEELVSKGVPENIITEDPKGTRTYESCRRLSQHFKISKVVILSQGFHLPRALYLCSSFGVESTGVYATGPFSTYYSRWYTIREVLAMYRAVWDIVTD